MSVDLKNSASPLGAVAVVDEHFTGGIGEGAQKHSPGQRGKLDVLDAPVRLDRW